MRYHIDTIPVWDAVKQGGECPVCAIRRKNELMDVDRFLGASVMEPDTRIQVNDKGFCARHQVMLYARQNRLGHALMMHTHLKETLTKVKPVFEEAKAGAKKEANAPFLKKMTGKAGGRESVREAAEKLRALSGSCIICESIEQNMERYAYSLLHLYKTDASFRKAFEAGKGVCLPDAALLLEMASAELDGDTLSDFVGTLCRTTLDSLETTEKDLEGFTLKFDYRNADKPWGNSRDALERCVNKLRAWCIGTEPNPK